jgi:hypothetical protein
VTCGLRRLHAGSWRGAGLARRLPLPQRGHRVLAACEHVLGALYVAAGRGLPTLADPGYQALVTTSTPPSSNPQTAPSSTSTPATAKPRCGHCAARANAASGCSPAGGAPFGPFPLDLSKITKSPGRRSCSPTSSTATCCRRPRAPVPSVTAGNRADVPPSDPADGLAAAREHARSDVADLLMGAGGLRRAVQLAEEVVREGQPVSDRRSSARE